MHNHFLRRALPLFLLVAASLPAAATEIELGLNLLFTNPANPNSGGEWQVIGRSLNSDDSAMNFGIQSVAFALEGINPGVTLDAPSGTVNGVDDAGFSTFFSASIGPAVSVIVSHDPLLPPLGSEIGQFFGFGSIENGSPNLGADTPAGANIVVGSDEITTLTGVVGDLPWATGDVFGDSDFDVFAQIASGTFAPGETPEFAVTPTSTFGRIFTSLGAATTSGDISDQANTDILFVETRTNFVVTDFNDDLLIDSADYTIFRDTAGATVPEGTGADANSDGVIDLVDYESWVAQFGSSVSGVALAAPVVAANPIPEPGSLWLLLATSGLLAGRPSSWRG